jgi:Flp pilus assembly protein TadD
VELRQDEALLDEQILNLLIEDRAPWAVAEVERAVGNERDAADGLARLLHGGLIHRCGEFVFASRPAMEAARLWGPFPSTEGEGLAGGDR